MDQMAQALQAMGLGRVEKSILKTLLIGQLRQISAGKVRRLRTGCRREVAISRRRGAVGGSASRRSAAALTAEAGAGGKILRVRSPYALQSVSYLQHTRMTPAGRASGSRSSAPGMRRSPAVRPPGFGSVTTPTGSRPRVARAGGAWRRQHRRLQHSVVDEASPADEELQTLLRVNHTLLGVAVCVASNPGSLATGVVELAHFRAH